MTIFIHLVQEQYSDAMRVYLEVGALTSAVFSEPVPYTAWDDQVLLPIYTFVHFCGTRDAIEVLFSCFAAYESWKSH